MNKINNKNTLTLKEVFIDELFNLSIAQDNKDNNVDEMTIQDIAKTIEDVVETEVVNIKS